LVFLGGVLATQGRLAEARRYHRQATRAPEDDRLARDEAYYNLGLLFRAERRYREALAHFDRAIALDPKYTVAMSARADLESALKAEVPAKHADHWRRMLDALGPNPATAHELVRAYTRRYPGRFAGWVVFADVLAGFARYDEAVKALRRGERLAKSENSTELTGDRFAVQWGDLYLLKIDFSRSAWWFRHAVSLRPSETNLTQLAKVLVVQGQHTKARRHLQRAIRLGPDDPSAAYDHLALIARARGHYAEALTNLDAALRHSSKYGAAIVVRRDVRAAMNVSRSR
jgi:tetratricopeptide (TPR) repeat protein